MTWDPRSILVVLANLLIILLTAELNHYLSPLSVYIYLGGALLTFGILRMSLRQGLLANGLTGLVLDSLDPFPFGHTFLLVVACHAVVFSIRGHFARENVRSGVLVAIGVNAVMMTVCTIYAAPEAPLPGIFWQRAAIDGLFSLAIVAAMTPWYLSLQKSMLAFIGIDLDAEQREAQ